MLLMLVIYPKISIDQLLTLQKPLLLSLQQSEAKVSIVVM